MVLGQNKNLLIYIHNAVKEQDIASVGFYIGGMKDADLKVSKNASYESRCLLFLL